MRFRAGICDDLRHRLGLMGYSNITEDEVYDYGLFLIDKNLRELGSSLAAFETMPRPLRNWALQAENPYIAEQLNYDIEHERREHEHLLNLLNDDQTAAYNRIMNSIEHRSGDVFFVHGPGGTGKTFLYNALCHKVRKVAGLSVIRPAD